MSKSVTESILRMSLLDKVTAPARAIAGTLDRLKAASMRNAMAVDAMRGRMLEAVGAGYALWKGLSAPVNAAMAFESAMADIKKVVDFDTPKAFSQMGKDIREMSLRIPMAADGIAQIVAAAGQSGIAQNELTKFAEIASKVGVAWDMSASDTGQALAKLKTALGRSLDDTASLADAINHLGNNSAASAPQILDVVKRVAPMAKQFGMTAEQVAALGSAMTGSGFESEVAATSILNVGRALTRGAGATGRQAAAFRRLGLSSKNVAQSMQKDAMGTLQNVLTRIDKLPAHMRASMISDLFGDEARALGPLVSNGKLLSETLAMISEKSRYAGSAQREFESASQRTANSLQLFRNRVNDLGISVGDALLPALNKIVNTVGPFVSSLSQLAQRFPQVTFAITAATSAVIAFRVASIALRYGALLGTGAALSTVSAGFGALTTAANAAGGGLRAAWSGLQMLTTGGAARKAAVETAANARAMVDQTRSAYTSALAMRQMAKDGQIAGLTVKAASAHLSATSKAAAAAQVALSAANAQLAATGPAARLMAAGMAVARAATTALKVALVSSGIGAAVVGIAMAGTWIYNNWSGIKAMFVGIGRGIADAFPAAGAVIDTVSSAVGKLIGWFENLTGPINATDMQWRQFGYGVGETIAGMIQTIAGLPSAIAVLAADMVAAGVALMNGLWDGIKQVMAQIVAYIKGALNDAFASAASMARNLASSVTFGLVDSSPPPVPVDGARARGGPVGAGRTYLVGERGPELFTPGHSGAISPNEVYRNARVPANSNTEKNVSVTVNAVFHINGATNPKTVSDQVISDLGQAIKSRMEASFSD